MTKLFVEDREEKSHQVPFLRGILIRSLQKSGLPFHEAHALASQVRQELDDEHSLTKAELEHIVHQLLRRQYGEKTAERYLRPAELVTVAQVEEEDGRVTPFSAGLHRRDLEAIGLTMAESLKITTKLRRHLFREKQTLVSTQYIARLTYELLEKTESVGPAVARRWLVWREFLRSGRPLVMVIGGTTGCGKSTIATALADQLGIVRMQSTDLLREGMRAMLSPEDVPVLYASSYDAWRTLTDTPAGEDQLVSVGRGYSAQADLVAVAARAVIERAIQERESLILEGVHAHPELALGAGDDDPVVIHVMLAILKRRKLKQRLSGRATKAVRRRADRYLEHFDDIWLLQSHLLSEADRTNTPIIVNSEREDTVREVTRAILDRLSAQLKPQPEQVFAE